MEFNKVLPEALTGPHKIQRDIPNNDKALELVGLIGKGAATPDIALAFVEQIFPKFAVQPGSPKEKSWPPIYQTGVLTFDDPELVVFLADITAEMSAIDRLYVVKSSAEIELVNDQALADRLNRLGEMRGANEKVIAQRLRQYEEFCKAVRLAGGRFADQKHDHQGRHAGTLSIDGTSETQYVLTEMNRQLVARINEAEAAKKHTDQKIENWGSGKDRRPYLIRRLDELGSLRRALLENLAQRKAMSKDAERTRFELLDILCWTDGVPEVERHANLPPLFAHDYVPNRYEKAAEAVREGLQSAIDATKELATKTGEAAAAADKAAVLLGANGKPVRLKKDGTPWPTRKPAKKAAGKRQAAASAPKTAGRKGAKAKRGQKPVRLKNDGTPWGVRKPAKK